MILLYGLSLAILGQLTAPLMYLPTEGQKKHYQDNLLIPYGKYGFVFVIIGIVGIIDCLLQAEVVSQNAVRWIASFIVSIMNIALGCLLGYGGVRKHKLSKNGKDVVDSFRPFLASFSIVATAAGIFQIATCTIWR